MAIDEFVDHVQLNSTGHNDGCGEGADSGTPWGANTYGCPGSGWGDGSGRENGCAWGYGYSSGQGHSAGYGCGWGYGSGYGSGNCYGGS